ncbi:glycoside hydrolase family 28 protein [Massilia endophytica]|uniref:glycoside hydrolase family 28 protein n=1 Tax=Massilia endophytica TaxID=2899220 RepID=UPI001E3EE30D|nr:glycoside hydrolase family 28 protein [Massilia endophytica]UGQ45582.1 glycoside hydrolase family 28 protein [Massilia endophytica]
MQNVNQARRTLIKATGLAAAGGASLAQAATAPDPWLEAEAIVKRLSRRPSFRKQDFPITKFGAKTCQLMKVKAWISHDNQETIATAAPNSPDCYQAIASAIKACHAAGGGRVLIPAGNWYCAGPIVLLSNVNVHLEKGAHIYFSNKPEDYAKYGDFDCGRNGKLVISRWQSNDCLNFSPMVYAYGQDNIALTGDDWTSILNGQGGVPFSAEGDCWWTWKGRNRTLNPASQANTPGYKEGKISQRDPNPLNPKSLAEVAPNLTEEERLLIQGEGQRWRADEQYLPALSEAGVPTAKRVFGLGHYLRPPMIQFISCTNVLMEGYQVMHTPFWQHHPVHCRNVVIRKVHANSAGPNSDGFDPEACDQVLVEGCTFDTGDDCIAIKAGKDLDTQYGPSQNIVIQDCIMQSGHGAVTLGSEMAGGIQNVYAQNLLFENIHWKTDPLNTAIRLKTNMNRGGYLRNFYVRNVKIPNGVQTTPSFYASLPGSPIASRTVATAAGAVVTFDCDYTPTADTVRTRPPMVDNVQISNITVGNVDSRGRQVSCFQAIVILGPVASDYNGPQPMPQVLPVTNVTISDCDFGTPVNAEQPFYLYNVKGLKLDRVRVGGKDYSTTLSA